MKENKKYFETNRLNKGYRKNHEKNYDKDQKSNENTRTEFSRTNSELLNLPPINILEEYEELSPGFANKLIEMAKEEQLHSQEIDRKQILIKNTAEKFGRFAGVAISFLIILGAIILSMSADYFNASLMIIFGFGSIITANIISNRKRAIGSNRANNSWKRNKKR